MKRRRAERKIIKIPLNHSLYISEKIQLFQSLITYYITYTYSSSLAKLRADLLIFLRRFFLRSLKRKNIRKKGKVFNLILKLYYRLKKLYDVMKWFKGYKPLKEFDIYIRQYIFHLQWRQKHRRRENILINSYQLIIVEISGIVKSSLVIFLWPGKFVNKR